jgi:hypothetical protein
VVLVTRPTLILTPTLNFSSIFKNQLIPTILCLVWYFYKDISEIEKIFVQDTVILLMFLITCSKTSF